MAIKNGHCSLCNTYTQDLPKHLIYIYTVLQCQKWLHIRNCMFYKIVDPPRFPPKWWHMLESLLGDINNTMKSMESDLLSHITDTCLLCTIILNMYYNFIPVVFDTKYYTLSKVWYIFLYVIYICFKLVVCLYFLFVR